MRKRSFPHLGCGLSLSIVAVPALSPRALVFSLDVVVVVVFAVAIGVSPHRRWHSGKKFAYYKTAYYAVFRVCVCVCVLLAVASQSSLLSVTVWGIGCNSSTRMVIFAIPPSSKSSIFAPLLHFPSLLHLLAFPQIPCWERGDEGNTRGAFEVWAVRLIVLRSAFSEIVGVCHNVSFDGNRGLINGFVNYSE